MPYGISSSSIWTSSLQYCSYYRMYFYNELTITSNLCHDSTFPIITQKFKLHNGYSVHAHHHKYQRMHACSTSPIIWFRVLHYSYGSYCAVPCIRQSINCAKKLIKLHMDFNSPNFLWFLFTSVHECLYVCACVCSPPRL